MVRKMTIISAKVINKRQLIMKKFIKIVAFAICLTLVEPVITQSIGVENVEAATKK